MKKTAIALSMAMALGAGTASAVTMSSAKFDMYDPTGALNNSDPDVTGSIGGGTWSVASTNTFSGLLWTAHGGTTFGPGTYTFDTIEGAAITGLVVGAGQVGGHVLFNWGATADIDVVNVWDVASGVYTSTDGVAGNPANPDGILGYGMVDGPFPGFSANFDFTAVPVPAAVWLFGSGLVGLVGVARRRRKAA
jgi:hypothetical protein